MPVPEAAMDEDYGAVLGKDEVRFARQAFVVEQVAKALRMQAASDYHFGLGVLAPDAGHHPAAGCGVDDVRQPRARAPAGPGPSSDAAACASRSPQ